ncbi:MAG: DUF1573 domain-containing protein [Polyangiaceae bacterium]|nr:DUF1573 domain-containing protein [Polyangiaceae bacterium]
MVLLAQRALVFLLTLVLLGSVAACRRSATDGGAPSATALASPPHIVVEPSSHDFGKVLEGEQLTHVFVVKNTGGESLEIDDVRTSCGCTAAVVEQKSVPPGGSTKVEVKFDTRGRLGKNKKAVNVTSNDPETKSARLEFTAEVEALLAFAPSRVRLQAAHGETPTVESWLTGRLAGGAKLSVAGSPAPGVAVEMIERKAGEATQHGVRVKLTAKDIESKNGTIQLATGLGEVPSLELPYSYQIRGNITVPEQVSLYTSRPNSKGRTIQVRSTRPEFRLTAARVLEGPFAAKLLGPNKNGVQEVQITATPPEGQSSTIPGKLVLVSNDPLEPNKSIKLSLVAPRSAHGKDRPKAPPPPMQRR